MLDLLITRHLFQSHTDIDPGELTDLRSANVNNENFAQVAVRNNLQQHLQHASGFLLGQITDYVKCLSEVNGNQNSLLSLGGSKGPKVSFYIQFILYTPMKRCMHSKSSASTTISSR